MVVGLGVDPSAATKGLQQGERAFKGFIDKVRGLFGSTSLVDARALEQQSRTAARALVGQLESEFKAKAKAAGEQLTRGLIDQSAFNKLGTQAAQAYNAGLTTGLRTAKTQGLNTTAFQSALVGQYKRTGAAAGAAFQQAAQVQLSRSVRPPVLVSTAAMRAQGEAAATAFVTRMAARLEREQVRIREGLFRGDLTKRAAELAGEDAGAAYNAALTRKLDRLSAKGMISDRARATLINAMSDAGLKAGQGAGDAIARGLKEKRAAIQQQIEDAGRELSQLGTVLSVGVTAPIIAGGAAALKFSLDFETAMANIQKTMDVTVAEARSFGDELTKMSEQPGFGSAEDLAGIAALGAQLGITRDELLAFTRDVRQLDVLSNLNAEEAATRLAQLRNVLGETDGNFTQLGSAIVATGNSSAATEQQIAELTSRMAGAGRAIRLSGADMVGFGAAVASAGVNAEAAGTALQTVFIELGKAAAGGGKKLEVFARLTGQSVKDFKDLLGRDAAEAVVQVVEALGRLQEAGPEAFEALEFLDFDNARLIRTLLSTAGAGDLLREQIVLANDAFREGTALQQKFEPFAATNAAALAALGTEAKNVAREFGDGMAPALRDMLGFARQLLGPLRDMARAFTSLPESIRAVVVGVGLAVAGLGPLVLMVGKLATVAGLARIAATGLAGASGAGAVGGGLAMLGRILLPGGLVLGGLALAIGLIYKLGAAAREEKRKVEDFTASLAGMGNDQLLRTSDRLTVQLANAQQRVAQLQRNLEGVSQGSAAAVRMGIADSLSSADLEAAKRDLETLRQKMLATQTALQSGGITAADAARHLHQLGEEAVEVAGKVGGLPDLGGLGEKTPFEQLSKNARQAMESLELLGKGMQRTVEQVSGGGFKPIGIKVETATALQQVRDFLAQIETLLTTQAPGQGRVVLQGLREALLAALEEFKSGLPDLANQLGQAAATAVTQATSEPAARFASLTQHLRDAAAAYALATASLDLAQAAADRKGAQKAQRDLENLERRLRGIRARLLKSLGGDGLISEKDVASLREFDELAKTLGVSFDNVGNGIEKSGSKLAKMGQGIRDIAQGVKDFADIANQLGIINDETAEAIGNVADLGAGIARIASGDVLGGLLQGLSGLGGLVGLGESPEEKERNRVNKANTAAIEKLTSRIGDVGLNISGDTFTKLQSAFKTITDPSKFLLEDNTKLGLRVGNLLEGLGLSIEDVKSAAAAMGLEFQNTAQFYKDFAAGLAQIELTRFAETFAGQLELLNRSFDVLGVEDPAEKFRQLTDLLRSQEFGSPAIEQALHGLDLSTSEGIDAARERLRDVFKNFENLTPEDLGGLTPTEFLDALAQATGLADEALRDLVDSTQDAVAGMTNVPNGFKAAATEWAATLPDVVDMKPWDDPLVNVALPELKVEVPEALTEEFARLGAQLETQAAVSQQQLPKLADAMRAFAASVPEALPDALARLGTTSPPDLLGKLSELASRSPGDLLAKLDAVRQAVTAPGTVQVELATPPDLTSAMKSLATVTPADLLSSLDRIRLAIEQQHREPVTTPPAAQGEGSGATASVQIGEITIQVYAAPSQSPQEIAFAVRDEFARLGMRHTGDSLDRV